MTWALTFTPDKSDGTIGTLVAVWNTGQPDEFAFKKSVNLEAAETLADFRAYAEKFRQVQTAPEPTYPAVIALEAEMNK